MAGTPCNPSKAGSRFPMAETPCNPSKAGTRFPMAETSCNPSTAGTASKAGITSKANRPIQICRVLNKGSPPLARIIAKTIINSGGLILDVQIIRAVCETAGWNVEFINLETDISTCQTTADLNIFLEHADINYKTKYPVKPGGRFASGSVMFVNQEWVSDWDLMAMNAGIVPLYKTRYAERLVNPHVKTGGIYVGFGMYPWQAPKLPGHRIPGLAIHIAGKSPVKGTIHLIHAMAETTRPSGKPPTILIITLNDTSRKFNFLLQLWRHKKVSRSLPTAFLNAMYDRAATLGMPEFKRGGSLDMAKITFESINDVYIINQVLDRQVINFLQSVAWLALCPSFTEGYGHYIDEARRSQINVLTTNGPPMNELITNRAQLIKVGPPVPLDGYLLENWMRYAQDKYPIEGYIPADVHELAAQIYHEAHADRRAICAANAERSRAESEQFAARFIRDVLFAGRPSDLPSGRDPAVKK
jgi:hypothetical protein